ncbi:15424_t:CDS:2 [Entrophospora sp. SA101]|nr:15424_t:CDS:2 [Entrophospora sp. SA101]
MTSCRSFSVASIPIMFGGGELQSLWISLSSLLGIGVDSIVIGKDFSSSNFKEVLLIEL